MAVTVEVWIEQRRVSREDGTVTVTMEAVPVYVDVSHAIRNAAIVAAVEGVSRHRQMPPKRLKVANDDRGEQRITVLDAEPDQLPPNAISAKG